MRRSLAFAAVLVLAPAHAAFADSNVQPILGHLHPLLIGAFGGGHSGGRAPHGFFFGADTGWAWLVGESDVAARSTTSLQSNAWCFGARGGYQLRSGLAIQARYDHLGVSAPDGAGALSFVSAGVRYGFPMEIEPFAEAMIGPAFHGGTISPGAALGLGLSLLATRHVAFDFAVRDWLVDINGVHHAPTVTLGITAGFGG